MVQIDRYNVIENLISGSVLKIVPIYPINRRNHWKVVDAFTVELSNGGVIYIKKGFEFDGSSSPRFLWSIFPSFGNFLLAACIHDWLYKNHYLSEHLGNNVAQKVADDEMYFWSKILNSQTRLKRLDNYLRFKAVRFFGKHVYTK